METTDHSNPCLDEYTYYYDDGDMSAPIPYWPGSNLNIVEALNVEQEVLANKQGVSTVWRCTAEGGYYPLDLEDERYTITYKGEVDKHIVYRFTLAAALAHNCRDYTSLDPEKHRLEFNRAFTIMTCHNHILKRRLKRRTENQSNEPKLDDTNSEDSLEPLPKHDEDTEKTKLQSQALLPKYSAQEICLRLAELRDSGQTKTVAYALAQEQLLIAINRDHPEAETENGTALID